MEFPEVIPWSLAVLPSDFGGTAQVPAGSSVAPRTWTASHGVVGMAAFGRAEWLADGMNTAGLSAHLLYMAGFCSYQDFTGDGSDLSEMELMAFLLGTCASLDEVRAAMEDVNVWGIDPGMGFPPPAHFLLHDETGSLAIEFHPEGHRVVENPLGVGTNSPYLDWHLTNVQNYVGLRPANPASLTLGNESFNPIGQGQGLKGMPGDFTPPSRFIRALTMVSVSDQPADGAASERLALHIANHFDIVPGLVREPGPDGTLIDEVTVWTSICNITGKRYAYRTLDDPTTYVVDLAETDFSGAPRTTALPGVGGFTTVSV